MMIAVSNMDSNDDLLVIISRYNIHTTEEYTIAAKYYLIPFTN